MEYFVVCGIIIKNLFQYKFQFKILAFLKQKKKVINKIALYIEQLYKYYQKVPVSELKTY